MRNYRKHAPPMFWSARRKRRHPCEKGDPAQRAVAAAFRWMLDGHYWRRHGEPFNKRSDGAARRAAKLAKRQQRAALLPTREYDDGFFPMDPHNYA